uniref:PROP1-like PPR domain-containing protein n=1 Tax=Grammatophora oceanica TaxID=210454 RepID=A0A7S1VT22_9STRA|mmetsp:Transcript_5384/g.7524  ORF Transcript_5384/g.7524 Transcript_5384/m.7524 type:complete len:223 (+) Transcript_5384:676-1344(+)
MMVLYVVVSKHLARRSIVTSRPIALFSSSPYWVHGTPVTAFRRFREEQREKHDLRFAGCTATGFLQYDHRQKYQQRQAPLPKWKAEMDASKARTMNDIRQAFDLDRVTDEQEDTKDKDLARQCHDVLRKMKSLRAAGVEDMKPTETHYTTVIKAYAKCGLADQANEVLSDLLSDPDVQPSILSFTVVIAALAQQDSLDAAVGVAELLASHADTLRSKGEEVK